ncbi:MAG: class I SAM-dependent RNA methyltransferase [Actinomyces urogenitalis]|uniref:class I SAM-dependent RNA methyltransferase n=1 Tax=Actinomyces urogenitalis TaxID=103621 RepID=UPI002A80CF07|nr:class I SAM-dependent RNA methyltransferase [Actinomyces urogenitalis]MDY3677892.1 class I SAM-dependent RNA methyltransferase [Actinomyces urogenitalis]
MATAREEMVLDVGAPAHGGHCVARPVGQPDGHVVFVRHALPGETVRAVMTQKTSKTWRAETVEVLAASPDRVRPAWAEAGAEGVGGGELSHVALPAQRTWKRWVLADCLRRIGGPEVAEAVAALIGQGSGPASVAVEAMPSEREAEASADQRVRERAGTATRTRVSLETTADGRIGMHGFRSAEVKAVSSLPLAVREIQELGLTERRRWRDLVRGSGRLSAVAPSGAEPVVVVDGQVYSSRGKPTGRKRVDEVVDATGLGLGELRYCVHADGFWQVHRDAPRVLVDRVVRGALTGTLEGSSSRPGTVRAEGLKVLELYSGAGLLTLPLASLGGQVRSLEGSEQAVRDARRNLHAFPGAHLFAGRVTPASVAELGRGFGEAGDQAADVVVLDPPRKGAGRAVVEAVADLGPRRVVLVACDPAAAARDLGALLARGYSLASMCAMDMFPHTHHFETLIVLDRD